MNELRQQITDICFKEGSVSLPMVNRLAALFTSELEKANQLLRSAYQIAHRKGKDTNWDSFEKQLKAELEREHGLLIASLTKDRKD
jgi:hypothetical protein